MIFIAILIGCILGAIIGINAPMISYTYSSYLAIAIIAALDSVFGGITSVINKNFDLKIFITGFFGNAILSILLTILGQKLNVDIYLAAIVVFVGRMFTNLAIIRRYYVDKWSDKFKKLKHNGMRKNCNCIETRDIGWYDTCPNGCKYCYANSTPQKALENFKLHNPSSPILLGEINETDTIQQGHQKSFLDTDQNLKLF